MALIVLVEDDPDVSRLLSAVLADAGHEVHVAVDGEQGVALVHQVRPDLALVDVGLPGTLDGFGVTRRIRADADVGGVPVWALTAHSRAEDREQGAQAGVSDYLVKPDGIVDLLPRIKALLG